jgi:hypothetical protein
MWSANWNIFHWLENQFNKITDTTLSTGDKMQMSIQVQCFLTSRPTGSACTISSRPGVVTSSHFSWCALGTVSGTRMTYTPWWRSPVCVQCIIMRIQVFWVLILCCWVSVSIYSFKKPRNTNPLTQRHIPKDLNPKKTVVETYNVIMQSPVYLKIQFFLGMNLYQLVSSTWHFGGACGLILSTAWRWGQQASLNCW